MRTQIADPAKSCKNEYALGTTHSQPKGVRSVWLSTPYGRSNGMKLNHLWPKA